MNRFRLRVLVWTLCLSAGVPVLASPQIKLARVTSPQDAELFAAIDAGDAARVGRALKRGANPNGLNRGFSALARAFHTGKKASLSVVKALLEDGARLDDETIYSALMDANPRVLDLFFAHGLSVNHRLPNMESEEDDGRKFSLIEAVIGEASPEFLRFFARARRSGR